MKDLLLWALHNPSEVVALISALAVLVEAGRRVIKQIGQDHALRSVVQAIEAVNSPEVKKAVQTITENKGASMVGKMGLAELDKMIVGEKQTADKAVKEKK